jgi:surface antigen
MRTGRRSDRRAFLTRRVCLSALLGLLAAALVPLLHPEPVSAASGVDDYPSRLKNAPQDSLVDPWQFYNRECTSWVAWRLNSENKVDFYNYWQGQHWGDASHWKAAAVAAGVRVDNKANRGAVAWWAAGSAGSSRGHVAWVQTAGADAITIEEYNYLHRGGYDTRTISSSSSLWPSGFIHVKDSQLLNTGVPTLSGTPQVGKKLKTTHGTWIGTKLTYRYQWLANGKPIAGATKRAFTPGAGQVGKRIRAKVTATKSGAHATSARSEPTDGVAKGVFVNTAEPTVDGKAQVGVPLAADRGSWSPSGTFSYQWYAGGDPLDGATDATYTPTADQLGHGVKVRVTLKAPGYKTMRLRSDPSDRVAPGRFKASTPPTVSGVAQVDQPLTASPGSWTPAGSLGYQWLVGGKPIDGATGTAYTPTPADLHKSIAIQVTVKERGYDDAVATSVPTADVAPGTFLNSEPPTIAGKAQVGVPLTGDKGEWSPKATIGYQWLVDSQIVPDATHRTFTPRPQDVGRKVILVVTASRDGYLTSSTLSAPTGETLPGVIKNETAPVVSGRAVVGRTLHTTDGSWSIAPDEYGYHWYAGRHRIHGATSSTYVVTGDEAGRRIHVEVTAKHLGYTSLSASSGSTDRVVFGRVAFDRPTIRGHAVVGRTLHARLTSVEPGAATAHYRWYRDSAPIRGAHAATYDVQESDLGHRIHVVVTLEADHWVSRTRRSANTTGVRTTPNLHVHTSLRSGRVFLRVLVSAPGMTGPDGSVRVKRGSVVVARFQVADGHGSKLLATLRHGKHDLTVVYRGGPLERVARKVVTVTVP